MKKIKTFSSFIYWVLLVSVLLIGLVAATSAFNLPGSYKIYAVQSGSMEPTIKTGSIVIIKPESSYNRGDVVTFKDPQFPDATVTHRIFDVKQLNDQTVFITKGDANNAPDENPSSENQVVGREILAIPYLGYPIGFARTKNGFILLIIIPSTIIIYSELINIKNETGKLIAAKKKRKLSLTEEVEEKVAEEIAAVEKK